MTQKLKRSLHKIFNHAFKVPNSVSFILTEYQIAYKFCNVWS